MIVKSPASTDEEACGYVVGSFKNAVCAQMNLKETFMIQYCCGSGDCEAATGSAKRVRGLENRRALEGRASEVRGKNGKIVKPIQVGYPPEKKGQMKREAGPEVAKKGLQRRKDKCQGYEADGDVYTRPADSPQIVATVNSPCVCHSTSQLTKDLDRRWRYRRLLSDHLHRS